MPYMETDLRSCWRAGLDKVFFAALLFLWLMPVPMLTQSPQDLRHAPPCGAGEIFNRTGWKIPGLLTARIKEARHNAQDPEIRDLLLEVLVPTAPADSMTVV